MNSNINKRKNQLQNNSKLSYDSFKINPQLSKYVYDFYKDDITQGRCYQNIYNIADTIGYNILNEDDSISVAYCYLSVSKPLQILVRHCVLIINGEIIDPTPFSHTKNPNFYDYEYFVFSTMTLAEYYTAISNEPKMLNGLQQHLKEKEKLFLIHFRDNLLMKGYSISDKDFAEYCYPLFEL